MKDNNISIGGGFFSLLTVLFIGLKLTGHIDWSWWWVLAPLWGPFAFVLGLIVLVLVAYGISGLIKVARNK